MIPPGRRVALFLVTVAAAAGGGYALASQGTATEPYAPRISCPSASRLPSVRGTAPAGVATLYLAYADGASIEAAVVQRRYTFRLPPPGPATGWPDQLRYSDNSGKQHAIVLGRSAFARCTSPPRAVQAVHAATPPRLRTTAGQAAALVNRARELAFRTSRACGQQEVPPPHVTLSNGSPSAAMLRALGVLRRPATAEELIAGRASNLRSEPEPRAVLTIFRRYVRIVHWPSGDTARIIVGYGEESLQREALRIQHSYKLGAQTHGFHPWLDYQPAGGCPGSRRIRIRVAAVMHG